MGRVSGYVFQAMRVVFCRQSNVKPGVASQHVVRPP
jgi:hypothetical protein